MSPVMKPASHPQGTTVEVLDLFYNTPVQRRFLKSDKTESGHTEKMWCVGWRCHGRMWGLP